MSNSSTSSASPEKTPPRPVIATPGIRLLSALYDGMLILALIFLVTTIVVVLGTSAQQANSGHAGKLSAEFRYGVIFPAQLLIVFWFYGQFWRRSGQTLGMQTWRLKTMRPNGQLLDWTSSLIRFACACVIPFLCALMAYLVHRTPAAFALSFVFGFLINYLFAYVNRYHLAIHDLLSGTVTVRLPPGEPPEWIQQLKARFRP